MIHRLRRSSCHTTTSGALHDAAILAPLLPTAMLFVASRDGISHNPAEFSRIEDIAAAADVLDRLVREADAAVHRSTPPTDRPASCAVCGPLFEHSPWIAERTVAAGRPFA